MANRLREIPIPNPNEEWPTAPTPPQSPSQDGTSGGAAAGILFTALKALSQRAVIALGNLFVLASAASAFWLWYVTLPNPTPYQLVGLGLYGLLILALTHLVTNRR